MVVKEKFIVSLPSQWHSPWPQYFDNFWKHCTEIARKNGWGVSTVANHQLRPLGGKLVQTKTQGWYLRWDDESSHTAFVLKWS